MLMQAQALIDLSLQSLRIASKQCGYDLDIEVMMGPYNVRPCNGGFVSRFFAFDAIDRQTYSLNVSVKENGKIYVDID
jgi:hypothetical protein